MFRKRIFHPILFGLFAVFYYHTFFVDYLNYQNLILHLVIAAVAILVLTMLLERYLGDSAKAALIVTLNAVLFVSYVSVVVASPYYYLVLGESKIAPNLLLLPIWCYLVYLGVTRIIKIRRDLKAVSKILGWVGLVLLAGQLAYGGYGVAFIAHETTCLDLPGDVDNNGSVNVGDVVFLTGYVFRNEREPDCPEEANCNGDEAINVGDIVYLIQYIFQGGPPPQKSDPLPQAQSRRPTADNTFAGRIDE